MAFLEIKSVSKKYGEKYALRDINLSVRKGEILAIAGPPGAGKTTLLKIIAGLIPPDSGHIYLEGEDITDKPPHLRGISMVFEIPPVYPDRTGYDNIAFPLKLKKLPPDEIRRRVYEIAELLGITHILDRKPSTFSGGEYQRVALARALITNPSVLLLDEPLKSLDAKIREQMSIWLKQLQEKIGITAVYTSHDPLEALTVGSKVAILLGGEVRQLGSPLDILRDPVDLDVNNYVNIPAPTVIEGRLELEEDKVKIQLDNIVVEKKITAASGETPIPEKAYVSIRPADVKVSKEPGPGRYPGRVEMVQYLGARMLAVISADNTTLRTIVPRDMQLNEGETVYVSIDVDKVKLYDMKTRKRIVLW